jgi:hypothetical protein
MRAELVVERREPRRAGRRFRVRGRRPGLRLRGAGLGELALALAGHRIGLHDRKHRRQQPIEPREAHRIAQCDTDELFTSPGPVAMPIHQVSTP